jgi:hypothetical protein
MVGWKIWRPERFIRSSPTVKLRVRVTFESSMSPARTISIRPTCSCPSDCRRPWCDDSEGVVGPDRQPPGVPFGESGKQLESQALRPSQTLNLIPWSRPFPPERRAERGEHRHGSNVPPPRTLLTSAWWAKSTQALGATNSAMSFAGSGFGAMSAGGVLCRPSYGQRCCRPQ